MRVIAGKCRSLVLVAPRGTNTRPTLDRIKETLFNMIQDEVLGSVFVDIFAGSGGIGIEALSRGASHAYFIEKDKEACDCINKNLEHTRLCDSATLLKGDVFLKLHEINEKSVDIIYIDPPYEGGLEEELFSVLDSSSYVTKETLIILEASLKMDFVPDGFVVERVKKYKNNKHLFLRRG